MVLDGDAGGRLAEEVRIELLGAYIIELMLGSLGEERKKIQLFIPTRGL
ncbi:hypothetical protein [Halegenticoccus tardaugens]|nr:hypothetical protein [Halegenticoccus tardaugens]